MTNKLLDRDVNLRVAREVERERHERALHDEQRTGLAVDDEFRLKDPRENLGAAHLKRPLAR
jgi:hypothetical protein